MDILFDCSYGVSGDMLVGALIDLGANVEVLKNAISSLNLSEYKIEIKKVKKDTFYACDFNVILDEENFDHDMKFLYGSKNTNIAQENFLKRNINDIYNILQNSKLTQNAKDIAFKIFNIVACAEAQAHNIKKEQVIFHETGAMDSIIDISSIAVCLDNLKVNKVFVKNLKEGHGEINTRVGKMKVPTPAIQNLVKMFDLKLEIINCPFELITPTGLSALCAYGIFDNFNENQFEILGKGYGAGKRDNKMPAVLKVEKIKIKEI